VRGMRPDDVYQLTNAGDPRLSPDARTVAYVRAWVDDETHEPRSAVWSVPVDGSAAPRQLTAGKRPAVLVNVNGYEYRNTVGVMGGKHMVSISAAVRKATGLQGGDPIRVTLTVTDTPREVTIPADFAAALAADEQASAFFGKLSNSMQRYHVDNITAAKSADTRQRRIDKAIALFRAGKQR